MLLVVGSVHDSGWDSNGAGSSCSSDGDCGDDGGGGFIAGIDSGGGGDFITDVDSVVGGDNGGGGYYDDNGDDSQTDSFKNIYLNLY